MGCSPRVAFETYTEQELLKIQIHKPSSEAEVAVRLRLDSIAKPLDGLGSFESVITRIGGIHGNADVDISRKAVIIMCGDNGVVEEGISQSDQDITLVVAKNMAINNSPVGRMASVSGVDTFPVDIGMNTTETPNGVINRKVRQGTRNFAKQQAMTEEEAIRAIAVGIDMVRQCKEQGYRMIATGEMGIGNTTTSSAMAAALLHADVSEVTGRGAGLSEQGLLRKKQVIGDAIHTYGLSDAGALDILKAVGGYDIAGLVGVCIGGALYHIPIVLDGVITLVAALTAENIIPGVRDYFIPSHRGKEPAVDLLLNALEMEPVITAKMALGEGTGAVMMFALLDLALSVYHDQSSFSDLQLRPYERYIK